MVCKVVQSLRSSFPPTRTEKVTPARLSFYSCIFVSSPSFFDALFLSSKFDLSLSSLSLVMMTLLGWTPMGTVAPLVFSRWTRSTWMTNFLR